ncbi:MAG: hypothetical protein J5786_02220 [Clostridiales bacterium]|nr:hypothetical protein [Clostridiales bacterium]
MKKIKGLLRIVALLAFTALLLGFGALVPRYLTDSKIKRLSLTDTQVDINEVKPFGIESMQIMQTIQNTCKDLETFNSINSDKEVPDMYVKTIGEDKVNVESVKSIMDSLDPHFKGKYSIYGTLLFIPKGRTADESNLAIVTIQNKYKSNLSYFDFYIEKKSGIVLQVIMTAYPKGEGTEYFKELWDKLKSGMSQKIGMPMSDRTAEDNIFDSYLQEYRTDLTKVEIYNKYMAISLDQQLMLKAGAISLSEVDPDVETLPDQTAAEEGETGQTEAAKTGTAPRTITYIIAVESL